MKISFSKKYFQFVLGVSFIILHSSCATYKNIPYFSDLPDTSKLVTSKTTEFKSPVIAPDDILAVNIQVLDQGMATFLNSGATTTTIATPVSPGATNSVSAQSITGYLVDKEGEVELPFVGKIKVEGLTTSEARDLIQKELAKSFNNPVVNVRFANFKITVLGEVTRPASYVVPNEKINIFDALGLAGDMTIFGRRENVLIIRDSTDEKQLIRVNLNSKDIVSSPYFYLKSNDIVYVEPSKYKIEGLDATRRTNIALITSALTLLIVIFSKVVK